MKVEELKSKIDRGEPVEILDVREPAEFAQASTKIPNSKNVPMGQVFVEASQGKLPKDKNIVAVCKVGGRCEIVARELSKKGYQIDYLEGGADAWEKLSR